MRYSFVESVQTQLVHHRTQYSVHFVSHTAVTVIKDMKELWQTQLAERYSVSWLCVVHSKALLSSHTTAWTLKDTSCGSPPN